MMAVGFNGFKAVVLTGKHSLCISTMFKVPALAWLTKTSKNNSFMKLLDYTSESVKKYLQTSTQPWWCNAGLYENKELFFFIQRDFIQELMFWLQSELQNYLGAFCRGVRIGHNIVIPGVVTLINQMENFLTVTTLTLTLASVPQCPLGSPWQHSHYHFLLHTKLLRCHFRCFVNVCHFAKFNWFQFLI